MLVLVTYDVAVTSEGGTKRLRHIAKACKNRGVRVQNSVFECEVDPADWVELRDKLLKIYNPNEDSLRFYFLGKKGFEKIEHFGAKPSFDILRDPLIF
jgi:CRISPR-associated protein Cas2